MMLKKILTIIIPLILVISTSSLAQNKIANNQNKMSNKKFKIGVALTISSPDFDADAKGFEKALAEAGFKEGIQVIYDRQNAEGDVNRTRAIAHKFLNSDPDLIHSIGTPSSRAVMKVIKDTPIVFSSVTDPVYAGLIPKECPLGTKTGTNATGVADQWPVQSQFKVYAKFFPKARKWGTIYDARDHRSLVYISEMREAAKSLGVELIEATVSSSDEVPRAARFLAGKVQAIYITYDHIAVSSFDSIVKVCNEKKIPLFGGDLNCVTKGALASYGWDYYQIGHSAGKKAVQILKGEKPGDIPWELGDKMILMINEKAARPQGVIIPQEFLKKADKIIRE